MKTKCSIILFLLVKINTWGQIGINTPNPQGIFHLDGNKNNNVTGLPTPEQQAEDFIVLPSGSVGISTVSPKGKLEIKSINSGFIPPRLTKLERDNISTVYRPTATVLYNTTENKLQYNSGTDELPIWSNLESPPNTFNTSVIYIKDGTVIQDILVSGTNIIYQNQLFNNTPPNYITKINNDVINLTAGKTYKVVANMGRMGQQQGFNDTNFYIKCDLIKTTISGSDIISSATIIPPNTTLVNTSLWNDNNSITSYINTDNGDTQISVKCFNIGGTDVRPVQSPVNAPGGIAPYIALTIVN